MKVRLLKINVAKNLKTNKNGKKFKTVGIEASELQYVYFYNAYLQTDPVLTWKAGDQVDIEIEDNGEWHNFKPITAYQPTTKSPVNSGSNAPKTAFMPDADKEAILLKIQKLEIRVGGIEKELNDLKNEGVIPE